MASHEIEVSITVLHDIEIPRCPWPRRSYGGTYVRDGDVWPTVGLSAVRSFDNGYVGKQPLAWKEYYAEHFLKELQKSMNRCTGRRDIRDTVETALNTIQSFNLAYTVDIFVRDLDI